MSNTLKIFLMCNLFPQVRSVSKVLVRMKKMSLAMNAIESNIALVVRSPLMLRERLKCKTRELERIRNQLSVGKTNTQEPMYCNQDVTLMDPLDMVIGIIKAL